MLHLIFRLAGCSYAIPTRWVEGVVPRVETRPLPHAPGYVVGTINRAGEPIPVVDLGILFSGTPCPPNLGTRMILVGTDAGRLGLIAESVHDLREVPEADVLASGTVSSLGGRFFGPILRIDDDLVPTIHVDRVADEVLG